MQVSAGCFHCGEPVPAGCKLTIEVGGHAEPVCCPGCLAVAEFILEGNLTAFYRHRDSYANKIDAEQLNQAGDWAAYNAKRFQGEQEADGHFRLALIIEGLRCAACIWLLRTHLRRQAGVEDVQIDLASGFTQIRWRPGDLKAGHLLSAIQRLGYQPHLLDSDTLPQQQQQDRQRALTRLLVAGIGMMQVSMYAVGLYAGDFQGMALSLRRFLEWVSLLVATPVVLYSARPFFVSAWHAIAVRRLNMDVPVALALALAYSASLYNFMQGRGQLYFDSVVMFVFFLLLARYVEMSLRQRTLNVSHALIRLLPDIAYRVSGRATFPVPVSEIVSGDRLLVPRGQAFPADGVILEGCSQVDESMISGESRPLPRGVGDEVLAGSINVAQPLEIDVTACGHATALSRLKQLLLEAQLSKPRAALIADRIASWFVAGVLCLAVAVASLWLYLDAARAFSITLSVLVVTCPCALSLATPAALAAAGRLLLRRGVLITSNSALETLAGIDRVVFDKTGTLTQGDLSLQEVVLSGGSEKGIDRQTALAVAAALERSSEHPLARAFTGLAVELPAAEEVRILDGGAIEAWVNGRKYRIGNPDLVCGKDEPPGIDADIYLADSDGLIAGFRLADALRTGAEECVRQLQHAGYDPLILSGDGQSRVSAVAETLGVEQYRWRQNPADKLQAIQDLQKAGHQVLMIGDGVGNDAPVLAGADVSMAVSGAVHVARCSADLVITGDSLEAVYHGICIARQVRAVIRQNLVWALCYNLAAVPLAAAGLVPPWLAVIGMSVSSLVVVLNAARLMWWTAPGPMVSGRDAVLPAKTLKEKRAAS